MGEELRELFNVVDTDKDGRISVKYELKQILEDISGKRLMPDEENSITDEYGQHIEFSDMLEIIANMAMDDVPYSRAELLRAFKTFDPDNKGYIPAAEMRDILRHLGSKMSAQE